MKLEFPPALSSALDEQLRHLRDELRASIRLRVGLAAIVAIMAFYALLQWDEYLGGRLQELGKLNRAVVLLRANEGAGDLWSDRAKQAAKTLQSFDERVWTAPSFGRAQASFQDWISDKLATLQMPRAQAAQINDVTSSAKFGQGEPVPMKINITLDFAPFALENFLAEVYASGRNVRVDSLMASKTKRKIEIVLVAWAAPEPDEAPADATPGEAASAQDTSSEAPAKLPPSQTGAGQQAATASSLPGLSK